MKLITLGTQAAYPVKSRACSGYLITNDDTNILLDLGTGSLANLFNWLNPAELSGIVITHLHPDHFVDIYPLRHFLFFDAPDLQRPLKVLAPQGAKEFIGRLYSDKGKKIFSQLFEFDEIIEEKVYQLGSLRLEFYQVPHLKPTFGVRIESGKLVYSSDCSYDEKLIDLARKADVFLCEATVLKDASSVGHLTPKQAGAIAQKAGVKKLFLTHIWPTFEPEAFKEEATQVFKGDVLAVRENEEYNL